MDMLKKDIAAKKCNACGYERQKDDLKRAHRCPKCNEPYILYRLATPPGGYQPNEIPLKTRVLFLLYSMYLFLDGSYGVLVNDLHIRLRRGRGHHFHDAEAWLMYAAFICACLVMISVVLDHHDRRNNEASYQRFAMVMTSIGIGFVILAILTKYVAS